jgi:hypothetical protein
MSGGSGEERSYPLVPSSGNQPGESAYQLMGHFASRFRSYRRVGETIEGYVVHNCPVGCVPHDSQQSTPPAVAVC